MYKVAGGCCPFANSDSFGRFKPIVDIDGLRLNACSADHFYLLGFTIEKSSGVLEGVEVIFVKSLLLHGRTKLARTASHSHDQPNSAEYCVTRIRSYVRNLRFLPVISTCETGRTRVKRTLETGLSTKLPLNTRHRYEPV
jgi:hypothetical protein